MKKIIITRRDFLKIALAGAGTIIAGLVGAKVFGLKLTLPKATETPTATPTLTETPVPTVTETPTPTATPRMTGKDIERLIPAVKIPAIEYHYLGYSQAGILMQTKELVSAQLGFFKLNGFHTVSDVEMAEFLEGNTSFPAKTFYLRIDWDGVEYDSFKRLIGLVEENGFTANIYLVSTVNYSEEQWQQLADWFQAGLIRIGSHSVYHADYRRDLTYDQAYADAVLSKKQLEQKLAGLGISTELVSFAFPSDSVPDRLGFIQAAGYKFCLGDPGDYRNNAATVGTLLVHCLYPYVDQHYMDSISRNKNNNPLCIPLVSNYTFDDMIYMNTTSITLPDIERIVGGTYPETLFGEFKELPISDEQKTSLVRPVGIIIHTDAQDGNSSDIWTTDATYNGLLARETDVHFAVDRQGVAQFLKMYPDFVTPTRGAIGFMDYISIEMCGRDYNDVLDPQADTGKVAVIKDITQNTIALVKTLIGQYGIDPANVLGHYQASASGKADPGKDYMEQYFLPLLQEALAG